MSLDVEQTFVVAHPDFRIELDRLNTLYGERQGDALYEIGRDAIDDPAIMADFDRGIHEQFDNGVEGARAIIAKHYSPKRREGVEYIVSVDHRPAGLVLLRAQPADVQTPKLNIRVEGYNFTWLFTKGYRGKRIGSAVAPQVLAIGDNLLADPAVPEWEGETWTAIRPENEASIRLVSSLGFSAIGTWRKYPDRQIYVRENGPTDGLLRTFRTYQD